tara:strand:- start:1075 stop:1656 length:582 start_codon:yes stop_codon:yes gene_type:complete
MTPKLFNILSFILLLTFFEDSLMAYETPRYELISKDGQFELRKYEPIIIAITKVESDYREASSTGFRRIANYIFGGNQKEMNIDMTAPVITDAPNPDKVYEIFFVMPSKHSLSNLPKPNYDNIKIKKVNLDKAAVLSFGGWATKEKVMRYSRKLNDILDKKGINSKGNFLVAQYNSPWVLPPFRKNEIIVRIN